MSVEDRRVFNFDVREINWESYVRLRHQLYSRLPEIPAKGQQYTNIANCHKEFVLINADKCINFSPEEEGEEYADTQSRVKGIISRYIPARPSFQDQQNARFLFNLFSTTIQDLSIILFLTATFTSTATLSHNSVQNCVPANKVIANVQPCQPNQQPIIGRRSHDVIDSSYLPEDLQFSIITPNIDHSENPERAPELIENNFINLFFCYLACLQQLFQLQIVV
jgi:hypothetical protein